MHKSMAVVSYGHSWARAHNAPQNDKILGHSMNRAQSCRSCPASESYTYSFCRVFGIFAIK